MGAAAGLFGVALAVMGTVIAYLVYQYQRAKLAGRLGAGDSVNAEVEQLKRRVATLEQLVTDDDRRLAGEISRLGNQETTARI